MALNKARIATLANLAPAILVIGAVLVLCSISRDTAAQEAVPVFLQPAHAEVDPIGRIPIPAFLDQSIHADAKDKEKEKDKADPAAKKKDWDPAVVSAGQAAFNRGCLKCHDAQRSLRKTKDYAGWLACVRRMAVMRDAEVPNSDIVPITVYLSSLNPNATPPNGADTAAAATEKEGGDDKGSLSAFAVISPSWRGGSTDMEDLGFVPEAWFGASWHGKVVSARVSACVTCHINKWDPVEAAVRVDFSHWLENTKPGLKAGVEAGRFIVPFSAFSNAPMLYRTVARPLIFTMGQLVHPALIGQSVLPMPFTDSGASANLSVPLCDIGEQTCRVNLDGYVINGLTGTNDGIDWGTSRSNYEINQSPTLGARVNAGIPMLRAGASFMSGNFNPAGNARQGSIATTTTMGGPTVAVDSTGNYAGRLNYTIYGFDVVAQYENLVRFQFEYAHRANDRFGSLSTGSGRTVFEETTAGYYFELEARPTKEFPVSAVVRYDRQERSGPLSPTNSYLPGTFNIQRFTWGVNVNLWRDSLLMLNHERWVFSSGTGLGNVDVYGVRYMISF